MQTKLRPYRIMLQNNVLPRTRSGPGDQAGPGPSQDPTASLQAVGQVPLDPLERFPGGHPRGKLRGLLSLPPRGTGLGSILIGREVLLRRGPRGWPGAQRPRGGNGIGN